MRGLWKQARLNMRAGSAADARVGALARDALTTPEHSPSPQARRRRAPPPLRLIYLVFSLWGSGPAAAYAFRARGRRLLRARALHAAAPTPRALRRATELDK